MKTVKKSRKTTSAKAKKPIKTRVKSIKAKSAKKTISKTIPKKSAPKRPLARIFIFKRVFYIPVLAVLLLSAVFVPTIYDKIANNDNDQSVLGDSDSNPNVCYYIGSTAPSSIYNLPVNFNITSKFSETLEVSFTIPAYGFGLWKNCGNTYASYHIVEWNYKGESGTSFSGANWYYAIFPSNPKYSSSQMKIDPEPNEVRDPVPGFSNFIKSEITIRLSNGAALKDLNNDIFNYKFLYDDSKNNGYIGTLTVPNTFKKVMLSRKSYPRNVWFRVRSVKYYGCSKTGTKTSCKTKHFYSPVMKATQQGTKEYNS